MRKRSILALALAATAVVLLLVAGVSAKDSLNGQEQLGKFLFFDKKLSVNGNQSCAVCHAPQVGWTGPHRKINEHGAVYEGSIPGAFGDRKPPSAAYAGDSPVLYYDETEGLWIGGMFWDGRATGKRLDDPLAEQAQGPFLNEKEQALPDAQAVIDIVKRSPYRKLFDAQCDPNGNGATDELYDCIGYAIAAYERSAEVNPYTSKFDYYLDEMVDLTEQEAWGLELFNGKGKCSACHVSDGETPLFTDFTYDNLGIPKNLENPVYDYNPGFIDLGLGGFLGDAAQNGKHKVPTLRNVDLRPNKKFVKAYGHNGYFKSLEETVHFYNTRDVDGAGWNGVPWPDPEVPANVNIGELGDLGLTADEEAAIVAFMKTLSDGYKVPGRW